MVLFSIKENGARSFSNMSHEKVLVMKKTLSRNTIQNGF